MWLAGLGWSRATVEALITWECIIPDEEASFQDDYIRITTELLHT